MIFFTYQAVCSVDNLAGNAIRRERKVVCLHSTLTLPILVRVPLAHRRVITYFQIRTGKHSYLSSWCKNRPQTTWCSWSDACTFTARVTCWPPMNFRGGSNFKRWVNCKPDGKTFIFLWSNQTRAYRGRSGLVWKCQSSMYKSSGKIKFYSSSIFRIV